MSQALPTDVTSRGRGRLSREIGAALLIKAVLLTALWALFFRGHADKTSAETTVKSWFGPVSESGVPLVPPPVGAHP